MTQVALQTYLEISACPTCHSKLILTKEQILFCQQCLLGFRVNDEVPDLRLEQAIHFRKKQNKSGSSVSALFTVLSGDRKNHTFEVKLGHCAALCRLPDENFNADTTFVGSLDEEMQNTRIPLAQKTKKLIEKTLSVASVSLDLKAQVKPEALLGGFIRDIDFLLDDAQISKTHALIYQNNAGVWLLDLVSQNGTFVNGKEVEHQQLRSNDVISLGAESLRVNFI